MNDSARRQYFNALADRWDSLPAPPDAPVRVARFVRQAIRPGDRLILDVGCGTGILLGALVGAAGPAARIVETDVAERMLAENRRKRPEEAIARVCAEALRLPFAPAGFDAVLCFGVLPHLGEAEPALAELWRYVRPGGTLTAGHLMDSAELNAFHGALEGPVRHDRLPTAARLAEILSSLGASVRAAEEAPGWYFVAAEKPC